MAGASPAAVPASPRPTTTGFVGPAAAAASSSSSSPAPTFQAVTSPCDAEHRRRVLVPTYHYRGLRRRGRVYAALKGTDRDYLQRPTRLWPLHQVVQGPVAHDWYLLPRFARGSSTGYRRPPHWLSTSTRPATARTASSMVSLLCLRLELVSVEELIRASIFKAGLSFWFRGS